MFPFRASHRANDATALQKRRGRRARKLGVEKMEGRLMLAGTPLEIGAHVGPTIPFAGTDVRLMQVSARIAVESMPGEGGFINSVAPTVSSNPFGGPATRSGDNGTIAPFGSFARDHLFHGAAEHATDWSSVATGGLHPATIVLSSHELAGGPSSPSFVINPGDDRPGHNEGGQIPLQAILAGVREERAMALREATAGIPTIAHAIGATKPARLHGPSDGALSGEWARAIIFAFADDESVSAAVQVAAPGNDSLSSNHPIDSSGNEKDPVQQPAVHADRQAATMDERINLAAAIGNIFDGAMLTSGTAAVDAVPLAVALHDSESRDGALDAAFEQFGNAGAAFVDPSAQGGSWIRSRTAMPLLVVLALERIAAVNSRRAARERHATDPKNTQAN